MVIIANPTINPAEFTNSDGQLFQGLFAGRGRHTAVKPPQRKVAMIKNQVMTNGGASTANGRTSSQKIAAIPQPQAIALIVFALE